MSVLYIFLFTLSQAVYAGVVLTFDKELVVINSKDKDAFPNSSSSVFLVEIGKDYFSYAENDKKHICDFNNNRIIVIDNNAETYLDDSLFMEIGFRDYEFKNRLKLGRVLGAASIKDNPMAIPLNEHIFSLTAKEHQTKIKVESKSKDVTFRWSGKELFKYDKNVENIKPKYK